MALFIAHSVLLFWASWAAARHLVRPLVDRILGAVLLAWANIVTTSLLLSCLHHLGSAAWFFRSSLVLALATWLVLGRVAPEPPPATPNAGKFSPLLLGLLALTLAPIAYASIRIGATYEPNNYDSLAYHLPRAMFYMGQNTLAHFDTGNPRQVYFPFNYNLLQLFTLIYSPPLQCLNFINLAAWATAGLAVYRLCRLTALGMNAALLATWLALTSTQILAQASATTNDLPTGAGLLCALVFGCRWRLTRQTRDALLAGLATGLTIGAKLTVVFFAPPAGLLLLVIGWQHWRRGEMRAFFAGLRAWLLPALLAFVFASPFALINIAEKGEWINQTYNFTLNRPFSVASAAQTSEAFLLQLFLEPLHRFTFDLHITQQLNEWGTRTFFPHWNPNYAFSELYLFPPDLNEDHVWFGFTGPVMFLCALFCLLRPRKFAGPVVWCAALGLGWLASYFILNKWSLYNHRYFVPAILVMGPCLGAVIEAGVARPSLRRGTGQLLGLLGLCALWLAGVYLFHNTSRPYAPLWADRPAPAALPALPPAMAARLPGQPRINIYSTDGNERIFLLMTLGRGQHFTSSAKTDPAAYNVFSEWGFPRKVAYSNIEQLSSFTVVPVATKRTAGVEFLGTIGSGGNALDYYGLSPHPETVTSGETNRNILVTLYYAPRNPNRYLFMRARVVGLNAPDHARLTLGVEYEDNTTATLATFSTSGEAPTPVTRPFRRFTVKVTDEATGQQIGAIDIPYLFRDQPPGVEAPDNPATLFTDDLIIAASKSRVTSEGLALPEGPYGQWDLPVIRWAKAPVVRLEIPATKDLRRVDVTFSLRPQVRETATVDVVFNGELIKSFNCTDRTTWLNQTLPLKPRAGKNVLEFRNVSVGTEPDWLDYLERYPDVKDYLVSVHAALEQGAKEHYEMFGRKEHRVLNLKRETAPVTSPEGLYYVFRTLELDGFRNP